MKYKPMLKKGDHFHWGGTRYRIVDIGDSPNMKYPAYCIEDTKTGNHFSLGCAQVDRIYIEESAKTHD